MRIRREGHAELDRLLEEALRSLERTDLAGANEALKKASAEAASLKDVVASPEFAGSSTSEARPRREYRRGGRGATEPGAEVGGVRG